jgi:hypothetical protein
MKISKGLLSFAIAGIFCTNFFFTENFAQAFSTFDGDSAENVQPTGDEAARDMLTDTTSENENTDSVSHWGTSGSSGRKQPIVNVAHPMAPISDSSFDKEISRGIASVKETPEKTAKKSMGTDMHLAPPPKALTRSVAKKKAYQEVALIANDLGFFPSTVFVTQGIPVRLYITGASTRSQCFMLDTYGVRRQIRSNKIEEVTFTPDQSGSFAFSCPMNGAHGNVIVKELDLGNLNSERMPASVAQANDSLEKTATPALQPEVKKVETNDIKDDDFGPEFH